MSRKNGVGQIIKASVTVVTLIALTGGFRVIKATLDDLYRLTRGARHAVGPAQLADRLITLHIIDEILNVDLHGWTPVRDRGMRCRQFTPSSHATTLESNKSVLQLQTLLEPFGITRYYTDGWGAYERHLDANKHRVGKDDTQKIESKHINLRTRIKRVVRRTLCFSKTEQMHDLAIGLFMNRYEFGLPL
jgi:insertion element IS1 protein InsB